MDPDRKSRMSRYRPLFAAVFLAGILTGISIGILLHLVVSAHGFR